MSVIQSETGEEEESSVLSEKNATSSYGSQMKKIKKKMEKMSKKRLLMILKLGIQARHLNHQFPHFLKEVFLTKFKNLRLTKNMKN